MVALLLNGEQNQITMWHNETKSDSIYFYFFLKKTSKKLYKPHADTPTERRTKNWLK